MENNLDNIYAQQEESIDFKLLFFKFYRYWYFFALTIFVALVISFLFNKYTKPVYEVNTTVLIQDEKNAMDAQSLIGLGMFGGQKNLENEIGILQSYTLATSTIKMLDFDVSYFIEENFISKELYEDSPFTVIFDTNYPQPVNLRFKLTILSDKEFELEAQGEKIKMYDYKTYKAVENSEVENIVIKKRFRFNENVSESNMKFYLTLNKKFDPKKSENQTYFFIFNSLGSLVGKFKSFDIEPINKDASILKISLKGNNVKKSVDFLNMLTYEYVQSGLDKKNKIAINTINFIDYELKGIADTLNYAEKSLQDFRTANEVMNIDFLANQIFEQMQELESQKAVLIVKNKYYNHIKNYITENKDDINNIIVPSSMGIEDPMLSQLIMTLTELHTEKTEKLYNTRRENPYLVALNLKIENTKRTLLENIQSIVNTSNIAINDINERISKLMVRVEKLPKTQRQLFIIERQFKLSDAIYTYLQQKRTEAQITKASNFPDNEVVDLAREGGQSLVFPKKSPNINAIM